MQSNRTTLRGRRQSAIRPKASGPEPSLRPDFRVILWPLVPCDVPRVPPLRHRVRKASARRLFDNLFGQAGGRRP
jgi:hypothetical protein